MDTQRLARAIVDLYELMETLRGPGGCPWDSEQTDHSVKMYLLEETYEVLEAIDGNSSDDVMGELGDLLFQIVFLARLAEERGEFNLADVMEKIKEKMIRRHPHVFGELAISGPQEVSENWDKIKQRERGEEKASLSSLKGVPRHLPALLRAHRLGERASKMGIDRKNDTEIWKMVEEEMVKLRSALLEQGREMIGQKIGELLFGLVSLSRHYGCNAEHLLRTRNRAFIEQCEKRGT